MDWYLERADLVGELRHEVGAFLRRHAVPQSGADVEDAELIVSEAVGNAMRHTGGPVWVALAWTGDHPVLQVLDCGPGFDSELLRPSMAVSTTGGGRDLPRGHDELAAEEESGRGLMIIRLLSPDVAATARAHAGMVLSISLPVRRAPTRSLDPPRHHTSSLPDLDEARPEGGFGKESFLRALVVQLSRAVEEDHGPDAAEAAVAQVGGDVGGQMEEEFRLAESVVGRLSPAQLGQCFVRLKHAIDGGFSVVEANTERVVLENTRCPFGEAVRKAPALCRMTSSVFGGIAARNNDTGASVLLEERIAVGDPGCRVIVYLGAHPSEVDPFVHHYRSPRRP
ncbi:ATP-binding protein [Oryzobacter sp. R7]|uniref:ATP-binding protein n=1 Tax=Oryzobacter faecalis TaxID=3388656 RepID=UPI00398C98C0